MIQINQTNKRHTNIGKTIAGKDFSKKFAKIMTRQGQEHTEKTTIYPTTIINIVPILKILYTLSRSNKNYTKLYLKSHIRFKKSFVRYIKICNDHGFIRKEKIENMSIFHITEKGKTLLEIFSNE